MPAASASAKRTPTSRSASQTSWHLRFSPVLLKRSVKVSGSNGVTANFSLQPNSETFWMEQLSVLPLTITVPRSSTRRRRLPRRSVSREAPAGGNGGCIT